MLPTDFDTRFTDADIAAGMARRFPEMHKAASGLWEAALADDALTPRMKELVLLGIFASPAGYNQAMVDAQIDRAVAAGASPEDAVDVLISVAGIANHALYLALPVVEEYFTQEEIADRRDAAALSAVNEAKEEFIRVRGFWNPARDIMGRTIPEYQLAAGEFSTAATKHGALTAAEREMIFIAVDASVNHMFEPGLRIHYENARKAGLSFREVAAVLKIVGVVGLYSYIRSSARLMR
ncbi:MAG: carboxymuconolactone decarboxylase family protein [Sphingobium sp.]